MYYMRIEIVREREKKSYGCKYLKPVFIVSLLLKSILTHIQFNNRFCVSVNMIFVIFAIVIAIEKFG